MKNIKKIIDSFDVLDKVNSKSLTMYLKVNLKSMRKQLVEILDHSYIQTM